MKNNTLTLSTLFSLALFMSACDSSSAPSETPLPDTATIVEVERGPVYEAKVVDAKGNVASNYNNSNFYKFNSLPAYPLRVLVDDGSWIDIDGDGVKTANDVTLDIVMSSYTDVITPVTTILSDANKTKRDALALKLSEIFNIPTEDLYKAPSELKNTNMALLTNAVYKMVKEQNSTISKLFNYTTLIGAANTSLEGTFNTLKLSVENNQSVYTDGIIDSLKLEKYLYDTNASLFSKVILLKPIENNTTIPLEENNTTIPLEENNTTIPLEENNTTILPIIEPTGVLPYKEVLSSDDVENIWNISFKIDDTKEYSNIQIGIEIIKHEDDGSNDRGEFVYSGLTLANNAVTPTRIDIWGETDTKIGGTWIDAEYNTNDILHNAISVSGDTLTIKLGTIIKNQTQFSTSTFSVASDYDITIVSSTPIFKYSKNKTLSLINNKYKFIDKQGMSGAITIK